MTTFQQFVEMNKPYAAYEQFRRNYDEYLRLTGQQPTKEQLFGLPYKRVYR